MENFKNESNRIVLRIRPLFNLSERELTSMIFQAEMMAESIQATHDRESLSAKIIIVTSNKIIGDVQEEIAWRN